MAGEKLLTYDQWDYKDVVKNLELSTVYIVSLHNIITDMIHSADRVSTVGKTFKKFDKFQSDSLWSPKPTNFVSLSD